MENKTTIQLIDATKEELEALKEGDKETFDSVVWRLIEYYNQNSEDTDISESRVRKIAREEINERVVLEALE